jgi:hypothetical protein
VILKYEGDIRKAQGELAKLLGRKDEPRPAAAAGGAPPKKGTLH